MDVHVFFLFISGGHEQSCGVVAREQSTAHCKEKNKQVIFDFRRKEAKTDMPAFFFFVRRAEVQQINSFRFL